MWMVPLCIHGSTSMYAAPAAMADMQGGVGLSPGAASGHLCPGPDHGPREADCRSCSAAVGAAAPTAPPLVQKAVTVLPAAWNRDTATTLGTSVSVEHSPDIHELQVQRT